MATFYHAHLDFHYLDQGVGHPFLFHHGLGGDLSQPLELYQPRPDVRLLALDARGHGQTAPLGDPAALRFDVLADDVIALLDQLRLRQAVVGGISMGAGVALNLALRYPARVCGLILVRPAWLERPSPVNLEPMVALGQLIQRYGASEGKARMAASPLYRELLAAAPNAAESLLAQFDHPRAEETAVKYIRLPADAPNREQRQWAAIRAPTLVLGNQVDPIHPFAYAERVAAAIPGAELVEITSKSVDKERHTAEVRAQIDGFLAQVGLNMVLAAPGAAKTTSKGN